MGLQMGAWNPKALGRSADGLAAILAGLKRIPIVRYDSGSSMASRLAHELRDILEERKESMFPESYNFSSPVLLILDRRADLVTPLLTPWTYESLVHELFKIRNGRVSLTNKNKNIELNNDIANKQGYEKNDHVLSETQDSFYKDHIDASFGELGEAVRNIVQELQSQTSRHKESIGGSERSTAAVRKFLAEDYGDFKRLSGIVSRHVSIVGEISHRVDSDRLLYFSEIEQAIAAFEGSTPNMTIKKLLSDVLVSYNNDAALRILLIYCLRFRTTSNDPFLSSLHISSEFKTIVDFAITYSTPVDSSESPKMLGLYSFCGRGSVIVSGKDTSNVYMRHIPPLLDVVDALVRGRLSPITFPALSPTKGGGILLEPMQNPQEVIVFFVNGSTYHEAHYLRMYCKANPAISVVLAGTSPTTTNDILNEFRRQSVKPSE